MRSEQSLVKRAKPKFFLYPYDANSFSTFLLIFVTLFFKGTVGIPLTGINLVKF